MKRSPTIDWDSTWTRLQTALINKQVRPTTQACANFLGIERSRLRNALQRRGISAKDLEMFYGQVDIEMPEGSTYQESDKEIRVVASSTRMLTQDDLIREHHIDMNIWRVKSFTIRTSEGYRKDRKVNWNVQDGSVVSGQVVDTGNMLVVPMHHLSLILERKNEEIKASIIVSQIIETAKNYAPKYPKITYPKLTGKAMLEIDMPDIHFGRLTWAEESGEDYDIKIAEKTVKKVLDEILACSTLYPIKKIVIPLGNDFYNVNTHTNTTVGGTPQQEDTRWSKTFRKGWQLARDMIETCSQVAPVDVLIIKGNHDEERVFYLGETLNAWFHHNPDVFIDNRAMGRKYYLYGKNLIGFTHGDGGPTKTKLDKYPSIMPTEVPDLWAKSTYREWHLGHIHHKYETKEENGVVIRFLRSLVPIDAWTYDNGFVGALRAAESFVWDYEKGLIAQFTVTP